MEMKVFSEKNGYSTQLKQQFGAGDDAQPFVGQRLISVADGMGGSGAQTVKSICSEMTDPQKSFDVVMRDCLPEKTARDYRAQYDENFAQLYALGLSDYQRFGGRHGSYFGSRLTSIFMRAALEAEFDGADGDEKLLELARMDDAKRAQWLSALETRMVDQVRPALRRSIKNGALDAGKSNVYRESDLMGTTYTGIVYCEAEDCVHAVCVQAGDSLPWALVRRRDSEDSQERLVLCQLMQAQEDSVGAITNFIGPNNDFHLRCDYFRLEKPCAIMAASDGAFDFFPTTIHFEQFLMYKLMQSNDPEDCAERLKQYYFDVNTNDDSSTIAFMAFGFDDYAQLQRLANRRQIELAEKYALDDETLYSQETGPNYALDCARSGMREQLAQFRDALWEESPPLREAALSMAEENNETRMKQIEAECAEALARQRKAHKDALHAFSAAVRRSWLAIRVSRGLRDRIKVPFLMGLLAEEISIQDEHRKRDDHRKALIKLSGEMRKGLSEWCDAAKAMENPLASADRRILERANDYYDMYTDHICEIRELMDQFNKLAYTLSRDEERIRDITDAILREESGEIEKCVSDWLKNPESIRRVTTLTLSEADALYGLATKAIDAGAALKNCGVASKTQKLEFARRVFDARPEALIIQCLSEHKGELSEALQARIEAAIAPYRKAIADAKALMKRRDDLISDYRAQSQSLMSERS